QILDNGFILDTSLVTRIDGEPNVTEVLPRLESFALAAAGSRTQGVIVIGIDPAGEDRTTGLKRRLIKFKLSDEAVRSLRNSTLPERTKRLLKVFSGYSYAGTARLMADLGINSKDSAEIMPELRRFASFDNAFLVPADRNGVLIGSALSEYLKAGVGDTLVLIGQGYHGTSAAGKYLIKGIVYLPAPDIDNRIVYLPVATAQELYGAPGLVTSTVICLKNNDDKPLEHTRERLRKEIPASLTLVPWRKLNELLVNQMEADNNSGLILIGILYLVIAFGVFGTVLMMLAERRREFGMLVSIGMQKKKLARVISLELLFIGMLGVIAGIIASLGPIFYVHSHPIRFTGQLARMYEDYGFDPVMPTLLPDKYFLWQTVVVVVILLIAIVVSTRRILRINVISSMRN
ncbi:MAG: FtsX-like permease family protein, partial [Bacteroidota bacterium]|nr:FtsX-like permease family protein [Bacteroidota bacterium]